MVPGGGCKPDGPNAKCNITGIRALSVDLGDGVENSFRYFGTGDVKITAKGGIDEIRTNSGFDLIDSGGGNDILALLGDRDDKLEFDLDSAGGADAILDGGPSFDRIQGGDGYDVLIGNTADDGDDGLEGHDGNDALFGGPGPDRLTGGLGNDYVTGDAGDDRLFLQDQRVDRWCDSPPVFMEQYNLDGPDDDPPFSPEPFAGDTAVCPADQF